MHSLVLLKRKTPEGIYVASGSSSGEVLAKAACDAELLDAELLAELPYMGHALADLQCALAAHPCEAGWYKIGPGIAFRALGTLYGPASDEQGARKPTSTVVRLSKEDRENLQQLRQETSDTLKAIREARAAVLEARTAKLELCWEDRSRLHVLRDAEVEWKSVQGDMAEIRKMLFKLEWRSKLDKIAADGREEPPSKKQRIDVDAPGNLEPETGNDAAEHAGTELCEVEKNMQLWAEFEPNVALAIQQEPAAQTLLEGVLVTHAHCPREEVIEPLAEGVASDTGMLPAQASAEDGSWVPNATFEDMYEDLSDLSSLNGDESAPHKKLKEYAARRRLARQCAAPVLVPCGREEAETACLLRAALQQKLGHAAALEVLAKYKQRVLRNAQGWNQKYWVDQEGRTVRLAR